MKGFENMTEAEALQKFGRKQFVARPVGSAGMSISVEEVGHQPKPSKYRNRKTVVDGITFDSQKEANRYGELKLLQAAGEIAELELQPHYPLVVNEVLICSYRGDFRYRVVDSGALVIEDSKGMKTPAYRLKAKLMKALFGITILES